MANFQWTSLLLAVVVLFSSAGCATTKAKRPDEKADLANQVAMLQNELQARDQQVLELQEQLDSYQRSLQSSSSNFGNVSKKGVIRVAGVTVSDVQRALTRAGFDPGPVDGRIGKKTKAAIKAFQRKNNVSADGIVGEKTWSLLQ